MKLSDLSSFIFDLDGVVWRGATPIEGAVASIAALQKAGKRCFYCTNNASALPQVFGERLRAMGIEAQDEDVMTSSTATALYLQSQFTGQFSAFVVGEEGLVAALRKVGARVVTMQDSGEIDEANFPVDCVVAGIDRSFSYAKLRMAQRCIMQGARFVATNRDATFPVEGGVAPGAGSIVSSIETASGTTPLTIGKPQPLMANLLIHQFKLDFETTAMIGDRLDTDIVFARRARIAALFVATGVSTREEATTARRDFKPDAIFDDLPALCQAVLGAPATETATLPSDAPIANAPIVNAPVAAEENPVSDAVALPPTETHISPEASSEVAPPEMESAASTVQTPDETGTSAFDSDFSFELPQSNEIASSNAVAATSNDGVAKTNPVTASDFSLDLEPQTQTAQPEAASDAAMFSFGDDEPVGVVPVALTANAAASPIAAPVVPQANGAASPVAAPVVPQANGESAAPVAAVAPQAEEKPVDNWWESMGDIFNDQSAARKKAPGA